MNRIRYNNKEGLGILMSELISSLDKVNRDKVNRDKVNRDKAAGRSVLALISCSQADIRSADCQ